MYTPLVRPIIAYSFAACQFSLPHGSDPQPVPVGGELYGAVTVGAIDDSSTRLTVQPVHYLIVGVPKSIIGTDAEHGDLRVGDDEFRQ